MKKLINDHRIKVTKMLIRKAFLSLLEKKPIQSISVKELCEEAGLNRGTFYSHYSDIYKLKEDIEEDMLQGFRQALEPLEEMDEAQRTPVRITTEVFRCLKENSDLCTVCLLYTSFTEESSNFRYYVEDKKTGKSVLACGIKDLQDAEGMRYFKNVDTGSYRIAYGVDLSLIHI